MKENLKKKNREKDRNKQNGKMKQKNPVSKKLRKESTLMIELSNETKSMQSKRLFSECWHKAFRWPYLQETI